VRAMNGANARALPDTNDAIFPSWSPGQPFARVLLQWERENYRAQRQYVADGLRRPVGPRRGLEFQRHDRLLALPDCRIANSKGHGRISHSAIKDRQRGAFSAVSRPKFAQPLISRLRLCKASNGCLTLFRMCAIR
jgi:hypothetical protein